MDYSLPPERIQPKLKVALTRKRLWFLYCLMQFIKTEIEQMTGWTRPEIDYRLRKWDLTMFSATFWTTHFEVLRRLARTLDARVDFDTHETLTDLSDKLRERLREKLKSGPIDWDAIDAFEWPDTFGEDARRAA